MKPHPRPLKQAIARIVNKCAKSRFLFLSAEIEGRFKIVAYLPPDILGKGGWQHGLSSPQQFGLDASRRLPRRGDNHPPDLLW
jgi:hypothetical protein